MAGGRLLSCSLTHTELSLHVLLLLLLLLLGVCIHDVEASSCQRVVQKQVGETVELSPCFSVEGAKFTDWKYGDRLVASPPQHINPPPQFVGRVNLTHLNLTVTNLTQQDSGVFICNSLVDGKQRTDTITLKVHNPISAPVLTVNSTWHPSNESCTFLLECKNSNRDVSYSWTVGNQTLGGPRLWHTVRPQEGDTTFTCTASNPIARQSGSTMAKCSNNTLDSSKPTMEKHTLLLFVGVAAGGGLIVVIVAAVGVCCLHRRKAASSEVNSNDVTVYADIDDIVRERTLPCSEYESIEHPGRTEKHNNKADTVYDMILLSRIKVAQVSPYQELQRMNE